MAIFNSYVSLPEGKPSWKMLPQVLIMAQRQQTAHPKASWWRMNPKPPKPHVWAQGKVSSDLDPTYLSAPK